jgi:hypothetical protein
VLRAYIPKPKSKRPRGLPTLEDKIVQGAVAEVLNAIYEADFLGFSYGFRPARSDHKALSALEWALMTRNVNWVLDIDRRRPRMADADAGSKDRRPTSSPSHRAVARRWRPGGRTVESG